MAPMLPAHYRRLACLVVMLAMLAAGSYARLAWGVPKRPYGMTHGPSPRSLGISLRRLANPLRELRIEVGEFTYHDVLDARGE